MSRKLRSVRNLRLSFVILFVALGLALPLASAGAQAHPEGSAAFEEVRPCETLSSQPARGQELLAGLSDLQPILTPAPSSTGSSHSSYFLGTTAWGKQSVVSVTCFANCLGYNWVRGCRPYNFGGQVGCTPIVCTDINGNEKKGSCLPTVTPE